MPKNARKEFLLMMPAKNLEFDPAGFEDFAWWVKKDIKKALKIIRIIKDIQRNPFEGIGRPEKLKYELSKCWSRRIDQEHRLVYEVLNTKIRILACRYHY
jgi:toxin YoeB